MNIWAHRGCSGRFPENTLTSFREAIKYDIAGIELDIQLSSDRRIVVIHDETVDRTTSGEGNVCDMTADELRSLVIEAPDGKTERIPFIEEVLDLMEVPCREYGMKINIELKNSKVRYEGMEEMILEIVRRYGLEDHVIYSSFCADSVKLMKQLDPEVHIGILEAQASVCLDLLEETGADAIHPLVHWIDVYDLKNKVSVPVRGWNLAGYEPLYPSTDEIETVDIEQAKERGVTDLITTYPELYAEPVRNKDPMEDILFFRDTIPDSETGLMTAAEGVICNIEPVRASKGQTVGTSDQRVYEFRPFVYRVETDPDLMYTYAYEQESNWTTYDKDLSCREWRAEPLPIEQDCFIRIAVRRQDGGVIEGEFPDIAAGMIRIDEKDTGRKVPGFIAEETAKVSKKLRQIRKPGDTVLFLVADSHYQVNGNWDDTALSLKLAARECYPDAVVHLGDITDGSLPAPLTQQYAERVIDDMKAACDTVLCCLGNHDSNYFRGNPDVFGRKERAELYTDGGKADYCFDIPGCGLRLVFLDSFDPKEKNRNRRYGFSRRTIRKAKKMIRHAPEGSKVIVVSHSPYISRMHYWSDKIKNSEKLLKAVRRSKNSDSVVCMIHGHNHADQVDLSEDAPVVSIGCSKIESFPEKKPEGAVSPHRDPGTRSQELWDIMRISSDGNEIDFLRFGAGEDRHLRKRDDVWEEIE